MIIKKYLKKIFNGYTQRVCRTEFASQSGRRNERPVEYAFVFRALMQIYPKTILDVGSGTTALPQVMSNSGFHVTAIDNIRDYWIEGMHNRHFHVVNDDITDSKLTGKFEFITCISVLEHIEEPKKAIRSMVRLLETGGHMVLTFPYSEMQYVRNVYELPGSTYGKDLPYITQSFSRRELNSWFKDSGCDIECQEYWQVWEGDFWTTGNQVIPPRQVGPDEKHQLACVLVQKRSDLADN